MQVMKVPISEILVYYDPASPIGKKTLAHAYAVSTKVNDVEYHKTRFTTTIWKQVLSMLKMQPKQLLNKSHPYYQKHIRGREFDDEGWLNILIRNPDLIIAPIAISGNRAILCKNPMDIYKFSHHEPLHIPDEALQ